jgi:hypothetical protein
MQDPSLALHRALQLYLIEAPQPPGHLVTGTVLRTAIKETHCTFYTKLIFQNMRNAIMKIAITELE